MIEVSRSEPRVPRFGPANRDFIFVPPYVHFTSIKSGVRIFDASLGLEFEVKGDTHRLSTAFARMVNGIELRALLQILPGQGGYSGSDLLNELTELGLVFGVWDQPARVSSFSGQKKPTWIHGDAGMLAFNPENVRWLLIAHEYHHLYEQSDPVIKNFIDTALRLVEDTTTPTQFVTQTNIRFPPSPIVRPSFFLTEVTSRCNMACRYCYRRPASVTTMDMDTVRKTAESIVRTAEQTSADRIVVQPFGGEPLLAQDQILELKRYLTHAGVEATIYVETNGTLLNDENAKILREHEIGIGVSFDGLPQAQNENRPFQDGTQSFTSVINGLKALFSAGYAPGRIGIICTATEAVLPQLVSFTDFLRRELSLTSLKLRPAFRPVHCYDPNRVEGEAWFVKSRDFAEALARLFRECVRIWHQGDTFSEATIRTKVANLFFGISHDVCRSQGCQGGYRMIGIDVNGNLYPCDLFDLPEMRLGNIWDHDIIEAVKKSINGRHPYFVQSNEKNHQCLSCEWYRFCRGGCRGVRYMTTGELLGIEGIECETNKKLYPLILKTLADEPDLMQEWAS